uniref:PMEI domain-containing protein n=1 Tax=Panagrellus redivivus TaxID=6233 RepID=A0A7E4WDU4_PANRE
MAQIHIALIGLLALGGALAQVPSYTVTYTSYSESITTLLETSTTSTHCKLISGLYDRHLSPRLLRLAKPLPRCRLLPPPRPPLKPRLPPLLKPLRRRRRPSSRLPAPSAAASVMASKGTFEGSTALIASVCDALD